MATPQESIQKAHDYLVQRGICSIDGSGEPDVEALFVRLALVSKELDKVDEIDFRFLGGEAINIIHTYLPVMNVIRRLLGREESVKIIV